MHGADPVLVRRLVRTRWAYALRGSQHESLLNTAYALEAAIDEIVFIFGPILAAFLATSVHPVSQLFVPTLPAASGERCSSR